MTPLRISLIATVASVLLLLIVFELIRLAPAARALRAALARHRVVLVVLSAWRGGLNSIAGWLGVETYLPAVLFAVATLFFLLVLLHYSTVISKLSDQSTMPAQRVALLEHRLGEAEAAFSRARASRAVRRAAPVDRA